MNKETLRVKITNAINSCSAENGSDTPDFILANYLADCLAAFDKTVRARDRWYGVQLSPLAVSSAKGVEGMTAEQAVGVALSIPMSKTNMSECQNIAPDVLDHLRRMGWKFVPTIKEENESN